MRKIVDKAIEVITGSLMVVMVIMACWQVFTRFVLNSPSTTSEEFLRYSLIWLTMVGAAYAYGKKKHLAIIFLARKLKGKNSRVLTLFVDLIVLSFSFSILIFGGFKAAQNATGQVSSAMGLPMEYLYYSLPISGVLFAFYGLIHIKNGFTRKEV